MVLDMKRHNIQRCELSLTTKVWSRSQFHHVHLAPALAPAGFKFASQIQLRADVKNWNLVQLKVD